MCAKNQEKRSATSKPVYKSWTKPLDSCTERKHFANSKAALASQYVIDKPLILCDVITSLPVYHMVNIERREGGY